MKYLRSKFPAFVFFISISFGCSSIVTGVDGIDDCDQALETSKTFKQKAFEWAMRVGRINTARTLLAVAGGINVLEKDKDGLTSLMHAAKWGHVNFILEAVREDTLPYIRSSVQEREAMYAFYTFINATDPNGMTALMYAAQNGHRAAVITLVRATARTELKDQNDMTASAHADFNEHTEIAQMLAREDLLTELGGISYVFD